MQEILNKKTNGDNQDEINVFAVAAVLCTEYASFALFIDIGGRRMIVFDPSRRDNEMSHETPNAGFTSFSTQQNLLQFLGRRMHEVEHDGYKSLRLNTIAAQRQMIIMILWQVKIL